MDLMKIRTRQQTHHWFAEVIPERRMDCPMIPPPENHANWKKKSRRDRRSRGSQKFDTKTSNMNYRLESEQKRMLSQLPWSYADAVKMPNSKQSNQLGDEDIMVSSSESQNQSSAGADSPQLMEPNVEEENSLNPEANEFVPIATVPSNDEIIAAISLSNNDDDASMYEEKDVETIQDLAQEVNSISNIDENITGESIIKEINGNLHHELCHENEEDTCKEEVSDFDSEKPEDQVNTFLIEHRTDDESSLEMNKSLEEANVIAGDDNSTINLSDEKICGENSIKEVNGNIHHDELCHTNEEENNEVCFAEEEGVLEEDCSYDSQKQDAKNSLSVNKVLEDSNTISGGKNLEDLTVFHGEGYGEEEEVKDPKGLEENANTHYLCNELNFDELIKNKVNYSEAHSGPNEHEEITEDFVNEQLNQGEEKLEDNPDEISCSEQDTSDSLSEAHQNGHIFKDNFCDNSKSPPLVDNESCTAEIKVSDHSPSEGSNYNHSFNVGYSSQEELIEQNRSNVNIESNVEEDSVKDKEALDKTPEKDSSNGHQDDFNENKLISENCLDIAEFKTEEIMTSSAIEVEEIPQDNHIDTLKISKPEENDFIIEANPLNFNTEELLTNEEDDISFSDAIPVADQDCNESANYNTLEKNVVSLEEPLPDENGFLVEVNPLNELSDEPLNNDAEKVSSNLYRSDEEQDLNEIAEDHLNINERREICSLISESSTNINKNENLSTISIQNGLNTCENFFSKEDVSEERSLTEQSPLGENCSITFFSQEIENNFIKPVDKTSEESFTSKPHHEKIMEVTDDKEKVITPTNMLISEKDTNVIQTPVETVDKETPQDIVVISSDDPQDTDSSFEIINEGSETNEDYQEEIYIKEDNQSTNEHITANGSIFLAGNNKLEDNLNNKENHYKDNKLIEKEKNIEINKDDASEYLQNVSDLENDKENEVIQSTEEIFDNIQMKSNIQEITNDLNHSEENNLPSSLKEHTEVENDLNSEPLDVNSFEQNYQENIYKEEETAMQSEGSLGSIGQEEKEFEDENKENIEEIVQYNVKDNNGKASDDENSIGRDISSDLNESEDILESSKIGSFIREDGDVPAKEVRQLNLPSLEENIINNELHTNEICEAQEVEEEAQFIDQVQENNFINEPIVEATKGEILVKEELCENSLFASESLPASEESTLKDDDTTEVTPQEALAVNDTSEPLNTLKSEEEGVAVPPLDVKGEEISPEISQLVVGETDLHVAAPLENSDEIPDEKHTTMDNFASAMLGIAVVSSVAGGATLAAESLATKSTIPSAEEAQLSPTMPTVKTEKETKKSEIEKAKIANVPAMSKPKTPTSGKALVAKSTSSTSKPIKNTASSSAIKSSPTPKSLSVKQNPAVKTASQSEKASSSKPAALKPAAASSPKSAPGKAVPAVKPAPKAAAPAKTVASAVPKSATSPVSAKSPTVGVSKTTPSTAKPVASSVLKPAVPTTTKSATPPAAKPAAATKAKPVTAASLKPIAKSASKPVPPSSSGTATKTIAKSGNLTAKQTTLSPSKPTTVAPKTVNPKPSTPPSKAALPKTSLTKTASNEVKPSVEKPPLKAVASKTNTVKPSSPTTKLSISRPTSATPKNTILAKKPGSPVKQSTGISTNSRPSSSISENSGDHKTTPSLPKQTSKTVPIKNGVPAKLAVTANKTKSTTAKTAAKPTKKSPVIEKKGLAGENNADSNLKGKNNTAHKPNEVEIKDDFVTSTTEDISSEESLIIENLQQEISV